MANDLSTEKAADPQDSPAEAGNSTSYPLNDSSATPSEAQNDSSTEPLGTPSERLQMLQLECRHSAEAGLPVHFGYRNVGNVPQLYILVTNVSECPACHWWRLDNLCDNQRCIRYHIGNT